MVCTEINIVALHGNLKSLMYILVFISLVKSWLMGNIMKLTVLKCIYSKVFVQIEK